MGQSIVPRCRHTHDGKNKIIVIIIISIASAILSSCMRGGVHLRKLNVINDKNVCTI